MPNLRKCFIWLQGSKESCKCGKLLAACGEILARGVDGNRLVSLALTHGQVRHMFSVQLVLDAAENLHTFKIASTVAQFCQESSCTGGLGSAVNLLKKHASLPQFFMTTVHK